MPEEPNGQASRYKGPKLKGGQTIVRVKALEDTLEQFNSEIGHRLSIWFTNALHPVFMDFEQRIAALEWKATPWWKKLWIRLARSRLGLWFVRRYGPEIEQTEPEEAPQPGKAPETADPEPETAPEPPSETPQRQTRTCAQCGQRFIVHDDSRICPVCRIKEGSG